MELVLEMKRITKEFPGVKALNDVNLQVKDGEIHALCGENGAGKSTLMKVLSGVYPNGTFTGDLVILGQQKQFRVIKDAESAGVAIIYQELALVQEMTVAENLFLGNEIAKHGVMQWDEMYRECRRWLNEVGLHGVHPEQKLETLGIGQQQLVEIAKALFKRAKILILDEPTAALTETEVQILLGILQDLKKGGVSCIYISHKLNEVFAIADTVTVLRDGETVGTFPIDQMNEAKVISLMVGRELKDRFPDVHFQVGDVALSVQDFTVFDSKQKSRKLVDSVSFELRKGEILGIAGLMGAGRTELVMGLFGAYGSLASGTVHIEGKKVNVHSPKQAIKEGLALVTEDRKKSGLVLGMSLQHNITASSYGAVSRWGVINQDIEIKHAKDYLDALQIKASSVETIVGTLSGGNQQKVVLAKWLMTHPKILILDEPTRGIDVGAKYEIYNIMKDLVARGVAIIMVSSELPEILGMSHRILVLAEGKLSGQFERSDATQEKIMAAATGGKAG